jgi:hypothetical protein
MHSFVMLELKALLNRLPTSSLPAPLPTPIAVHLCRASMHQVHCLLGCDQRAFGSPCVFCLRAFAPACVRAPLCLAPPRHAPACPTQAHSASAGDVGGAEPHGAHAVNHPGGHYRGPRRRCRRHRAGSGRQRTRQRRSWWKQQWWSRPWPWPRGGGPRASAVGLRCPVGRRQHRRSVCPS